jgi:hypothetical protein
MGISVYAARNDEASVDYREVGMIYKVLITHVEPSVNDRPNYSGVLADYEIDAASENEARNLAFSRFCKEKPYHSLNRDDFIIDVH